MIIIILILVVIVFFLDVAEGIGNIAEDFEEGWKDHED